MIKRGLSYLNKGMTLASLFFYPLTASLQDSPFVFQWKRQNTVELVLTLCIISVGAGATLWALDVLASPGLRAVIVPLVLLPPAASFTIHITRQSGVGNAWSELGANLMSHRRLGIAAGSVILVSILLIARRFPTWTARVGETILLVCCPLNLFSLWTIMTIARFDVVDSLKGDFANANMGEESRSNDERRVLIFLFDEMSYEYLYSGGSVRPELPIFVRLSATSDNYHAATAPGEETVTSMVGYITGNRYHRIGVERQSSSWPGRSPGRISAESRTGVKVQLTMDSTNIFALARRRGMQTVVAGPLLPYCEMLGEWLSECRSFSIYNYASVNRRLAFYNPIFTNIILWPRQFPTGLLKGVVYSVWQKGVIEQSFEIASKALERRGPLFLFVHFSVPHLPFVFDRDGYYRNPTPFLQNRENYLKQLEYADALFGKLMMTVKKRGAYGSSDIVVLSDHNYRIMFPEKKDEIPLIVKRANQGVRHDVYEPARAEEVIRAIVER